MTFRRKSGDPAQAAQCDAVTCSEAADVEPARDGTFYLSEEYARRAAEQILTPWVPSAVAGVKVFPVAPVVMSVVSSSM